MTALIYDGTSTWEIFDIDDVQTSARELRHRGPLRHAYEAGAHVVEAQLRTYYLEASTSRLMQDDGLQANPTADNVVGLQFRYFADPAPPLAPKPPVGAANCLYDDSGRPRLPALAARDGSLVELTDAVLTDGPWCGAADRPFDADLFRLRTVRVSLRVQASLATLRGANPTWFRQPGTACGGERFVPDFGTSFDVSPRNLNLAR